MTEKFLDRIYAANDQDAINSLYDEWSATYEAEISANGYATPARCAEALAAYMPDKTTPVLDFGCGTGLSGMALRLAGFEVIDGVDLSPQMIAVAAEKGIYRTLNPLAPSDPVPQGYALMSAVGVIGPGAAPITVLDSLLHALLPEGKLVFSLNERALADPGNTGMLNEWLDCGAARLLFAEDGPHLPGMDLKATVYVVEKS
jgi:predicted TPR repeat methyltransferase